MKNHLSSNTWIKQTSKYIPFVRSQCNDIDFVRFDIFIKTFKKIVILHHIIMDFKFRILFLKIFFNTGKLLTQNINYFSILFCR